MRDKDQNIRHAANPQPGDYWHEMFAPTALVLDASTYHVAFLNKRKEAGPNHWTWDTSHIEVKSRAEFQKWLSYGSIPGTISDVVPNWKHWREFADEALATSGVAAAGHQVISPAGTDGGKATP